MRSSTIWDLFNLSRKKSKRCHLREVSAAKIVTYVVVLVKASLHISLQASILHLFQSVVIPDASFFSQFWRQVKLFVTLLRPFCADDSLKMLHESAACTSPDWYQVFHLLLQWKKYEHTRFGYPSIAGDSTVTMPTKCVTPRTGFFFTLQVLVLLF